MADYAAVMCVAVMRGGEEEVGRLSKGRPPTTLDPQFTPVLLNHVDHIKACLSLVKENMKYYTFQQVLGS